MISQSLNGPWEFRQSGTPAWLPASVPGGVHTDLMAAGRIPDPFVGTNEKQVQWVSAVDWEYRRTFETTPALFEQERVYLVCDGLDTLADLELNGQPLGPVDNMFRSYRWEVKGLLQPGANQLSILFHSPDAYTATCQQQRKLPGMTNPGAAHLRKAPCHFGWDWGPRLPCIGIWRSISLEGHSTAHLEQVHLRQQHNAGSVALSISAACQTWGDAALSLSATITAPDGTLMDAATPFSGNEPALLIPIENPQLWWPNGHGLQPLYQVEVTLMAGGVMLDNRHFQVGLRTLELRQQDDAWGRSFTFVVNDVPLFAKGANWIPADSFPTRMTYERYEHLIHSAAAANMNMLRVWGGGYYEDEIFYALCDRYGILIWQDFMFACAVYPLDEPAFLENMRLEVIENVRRLRHHACLALWCGNNEIEMMWPVFHINRGKHASLGEAYQRFFWRLLPEMVQAEDPDHAFWPSSPCSTEFLKKTNNDSNGDTHLWQIWHGMQPFTAYHRHLSRFVSEFGFESLPALETVASVAHRSEWDLKSPTLKHHQRCPAGNEKLIYYLTERFRLPKDFPSLVYLTQVVQAEGMRTGIEHWRRNRARCNGTLYWQLNDCWPVSSWSSIDSVGRWKALHYSARRFNAPVALSLEDKKDQVGIFVTNDLPVPWQGEVRWSLETLTGQALQTGQEAVSAVPLAATCLCRLDFKEHLRQPPGRTNIILVAELWQADQRLSSQVLTFVSEKAMQLLPPELAAEVQVEQGELAITLTAHTLARFIELSLSGASVIFSDNYFDLPAGRTAQVTSPVPDGWTLDQARRALKMRSLADIQPAGSPLSDSFQHFLAGANLTNLFSRFFASLM
jgi:beta-mannosidase